MITVSGSLNADWRQLTPGDLVVSVTPFFASWPPDGCRHITTGSVQIWSEKLECARIGHDMPFTIISNLLRENEGPFDWHQRTWSIIMHEGRFWWVGTSASGSL